MRFREQGVEARMFQENIYPVNDNNNNNNIQQDQQHPSLPPSRFQRRSQRLRRQDNSTTPSESIPIVSIPPVTLSVSVGVSAPPLSGSEDPSTTESPTPSSSYIYNSAPDTSSTSSLDSLSSSCPFSSSSLPSSSESPSTSSSQDSPTFTPPSTTTQPSYTPPNDRISLPMSSQTSSLPPTSSPTSSSSGPTITDTPPPPPPPSSSSSSPTPTMSSSVNSPPPPPPPPSSSSNSGLRDDQSTSNSPPPSTSVSPPSSSISISISVSSPDGGVDNISTTSTSTSTPTPPPSSSSSSSTQPGNVDVGGGSVSPSVGGGSLSSSSSAGPSSPDRPAGSTSSPRPPTTPNGSVNPVPNVPMQSDGSPTDGSPAPMTTLSEPVTFTTTDASGSTILTVPPQFTTVIVTTLPGGTFTTVTEVVANPPGVLNQGDANRDSVAAFFQNKGAVAGVFVAISLTICAIVLFVIFALRRRRYRVQNERDAEIAAGLAAAASNQRFADDEDHPVVMRNVPSAMRGRSPWLDDDDDAYHTSAGPVMYSSYTGVGPPIRNMPITSEIAYPVTAARYTHARSNSGSPSPKKDFAALPPTTSFPFEPVSPTGNSGWSSHGGAYVGGRDSVSPVPTNSAPASANHGTATHAATSAGHAPSSYGGHRPPASVGRDGSGPGTGSGSGSRSGGTSQPSLMTATAAQPRASSPKLEEMYPPEYAQFSRPNSSAAVMGYAYEPDPVPHEHQIVTDLREVQGAYDGIRSPLSGDVAAMSVGSRSMYSHEGEGTDDEGDIRPREDSRLDPVMRMTGGLASAASVGPRDHEDYTRRVVPQQVASPSTGSHSYSLGHSHSTH